jgi:hypothetical protein
MKVSEGLLNIFLLKDSRCQVPHLIPQGGVSSNSISKKEEIHHIKGELLR